MPSFWTKFAVAKPTSGSQGQVRPGVLILKNNKYQVVVARLSTPAFGFGQDAKWFQLSIRRLDREYIRDWRDLQRIKNEILGPEAEGIEIFPAESRLNDTANQYFMWCVVGAKFPIGPQDRLVCEESGHGAVQRPFPDDAKPPDLMSADAVYALNLEYLKKMREEAGQ